MTMFFSVNKRPKGLCSWDSSCLITLIKIAIVTGCSVCLLVQSYHCLNRYDDYETTATLAVKPTGEASFLSFTFCPNFHSAYDKEKLKQYGMNKRDLQNGIYRNTEKDKSHRMLFEEVSFSLQDLLKYVQLGSWSPGNATLDFPVDGTLDPSLGQWSSKPHITYGYCHNLDVKNKAKNLGVSYLYVESYMGLYIYLHHDGQFLDYDSNSKVGAEKGEFLFIDIAYELTVDTLEMDSALPCDSAMNYHLDDCLYEKMTRRLVEDFGCSIPYLPNLNDEPICSPDGNGTIASKQYNEMKANGQRDLCHKPCERTEVFSGMAFSDSVEEELAKIKIYLKTTTKVKKSVLDYPVLTMIAEIGGYTGLLLGISLVNLTSVLDRFFERLIGH